MAPTAHPASSIVLADCVGRGHVNTGMQRYEELKSLYDRTNPDQLIDVTNAMQLAISAITNLSLGLEIFLKIHHFQQVGHYPNGHDIGTLATSFTEVVLNGLRARYAELHQDPSLPWFVTFSLAAGEEGKEHSIVWPADATDFDTASQSIGRAYERWRYIYEKLNKPLTAVVAFKPLMLLIFTMDWAIRSYKSTSFISVTGEAT